MARTPEFDESGKRIRKPTAADLLDEFIDTCSEDAGLTGWDQLVRTVSVPNDLVPALLSGRRELLAAAKPRAMNEEEVAALYELISTLIETNQLLQRHAQMLAQQVANWGTLFKGLAATGRRIEHFANFRRTDMPEEEEG